MLGAEGGDLSCWQPSQDPSALLTDLQVPAGPWNSPAHSRFKVPLCQVFVLLQVPWGVLAGVTPLTETGKLVVSTEMVTHKENTVGTTLSCSFVSMNLLPSSSPLPKGRAWFSGALKTVLNKSPFKNRSSLAGVGVRLPSCPRWELVLDWLLGNTCHVHVSVCSSKEFKVSLCSVLACSPSCFKNKLRG